MGTMVRTKTKITACVGLALAIPPMFSGAAGAADAPTSAGGPATSGPSAPTSTRVEGDMVLYTASADGAGAEATTNASAIGTGSGWGARFTNTLWSNTSNTRVGVHSARMERTSGSGEYGTSAHVALMRGGYDGDTRFSYETDSCASVAEKNAAAVTCGSEGFATSSGQLWTQAAGGEFDQGNNGSNWGVYGSTDIQWRTP
jgi:hypothetical protein